MLKKFSEENIDHVENLKVEVTSIEKEYEECEYYGLAKIFLVHDLNDIVDNNGSIGSSSGQRRKEKDHKDCALYLYVNQNIPKPKTKIDREGNERRKQNKEQNTLPWVLLYFYTIT